MNYLFKFFSIISTLIFITNAQQVYIQCLDELTQKYGVCKYLNECPAVQAAIKQQQQYAKCNFEGEWVCCPDNSDKTIETFQTSAPNLNGATQNFLINSQNLGSINQHFQNQNIENQSSLLNTNLENRNTPVTQNLRLIERKCNEYKSYVYEYVYSMSLALDADRSKIPIDKCGHKSIQLIVGGEDAKLGEFPHMALIGYASSNPNEVEWLCSGTLISERFVLTAAHCLDSKGSGKPKAVRLGDLDIVSTRDDANLQQFEVSDIIYYPVYTPHTKYHDIGLLKLNRNAMLNPFIIPACLPTSFETADTKFIATGWGRVKYEGGYPTNLQKVVLEKFTQDECNNFYVQTGNPKLPQGIRRDAQVCAGSKLLSKDTCQGDSGGPIQIYHPSAYCMYMITGITSFGHGCGNIGVPGVYARVSNYIDWIEETVWPGER